MKCFTGASLSEPANESCRSGGGGGGSTPRHLKNKLYVHTQHPLTLSLLSALLVGSRPPVASPQRAHAPFPCVQSLVLRTWGSGSEATQGWGLRLRGLGVTWGDETLLQFSTPPPPTEESVGSEREGVSSCAQAARGPRLASRVPQRRRALSLWPGEKSGERLQISQGEEWNEPKRACVAYTHQPPYPKSGAAGAQIRLRSCLCTGVGVPWWQRESTTSDFRTESARSSDLSRQEGLAWRRDRGRARGQAKAGVRGHKNPRGYKVARNERRPHQQQ